MDQPLTSSDHLGGGGGAVGAEEEAGARVGQEREQEGEGKKQHQILLCSLYQGTPSRTEQTANPWSAAYAGHPQPAAAR